MSAPTFSVLLPAYNGESTLADALDSLIAQSRSDWEAIVVDDGSLDSTAEIAARYSARDPRVISVSKPNGGTSSARNAAAELASAPFLALLDQDDQFLPDYFEKMGDFIDCHPEFDIFSCNAYYVYADGRRELRHPLDVGARSFGLDDLVKGCCIHPQAVFRRSVFDAVHGFDEDPRCWTEDYDFWLRAMVAGARHIYNPEVLALYRWSPDQKSSSQAGCTASDTYILEKLVRSGALRGEVRTVAKRRLKSRARATETAALSARRELEGRLATGEIASARSLYVRSRKSWANPWKYALGMPIVMLSPRIFARLFGADRSSR